MAKLHNLYLKLGLDIWLQYCLMMTLKGFDLPPVPYSFVLQSTKSGRWQYYGAGKYFVWVDLRCLKTSAAAASYDAEFQKKRMKGLSLECAFKKEKRKMQIEISNFEPDSAFDHNYYCKN